MNTLRNIGKLLTTSVLAGVFASAIMLGIGRLHATVGTVPPAAGGFALVDIQWLLGIVGGVNWTYQNGIVAKASGTQLTCTVLPSNVYLLSVDTVVTNNDSVCLPFATAGANINVANQGAATLAIFGQAANNPGTSPAAADTINGTAGSSSYTMTTNTNVECFAATVGKWKCVKGS